MFQGYVYNVDVNTSFAVFLFFSIVFAYNVHDIPRKDKSLPKDSLPLYLGFSGSFISLFWLPFSFMKYLIPVAVITLLYTYSFLPANKKLRDLPYVKIFILSGVLSFMSTVAPFINASIDTFVMSLMFLSRFIFFFILCLLFDIRDVEKDREHGVTTLATGLSEFALKNASIFFIAVLVLSEVYLANHFITDVDVMMSMIISSLAVLPFFFPLQSSPRTTLFSFSCDGVIALPFLFYSLFDILGV